MRNLLNFYSLFYGFDFHRNFTRPFDFPKIRKCFPHELWKVRNPKNLLRDVSKNRGMHPCFISLYDYGSNDNLKQKNPSQMVLDRAFFDFDIANSDVKEIKNKLITLRNLGKNHFKDKQDELRQELQDLLVNDYIAKPAINEAKDFSEKFKERFDNYPLLFFSGCKGAHVYTFFEPIHVNIKNSLSYFVNDVKKNLNYQTIDLSVYGVLNSRVPYSQHQYTSLTVVPFTIEDSYADIMNKALNPNVELFRREKYLSSFGNYLTDLNEILEYNKKMEDERKTFERKLNPIKTNHYRNLDHREWFKQVIGEPVKEYEHYNMYNCPFKDHEDIKPSFMVYKRGFKCIGCVKRGNHFQFLKDMNGWSDDQVKNHLKNKVLITRR